MTDRRPEVHWVPGDPDAFVLWGSDLRLYKVVEGHPGNAEGLPIGRDRWAVLEASLSEPHYIKCVDLWHGPGLIVAAGQATGRVSLVSFGMPEPTLADRLRRTELSPKQPRNCAALAWHRAETSLLAVGFDRMRSDCGVMVWDVAAGEGRLVEAGQPGDHCSSLAWVGRSSCLAAGLNGRTVRVFDTRANPQKHVAGTQTKATFGVCVDPTNDDRIAGHSESQVVIWDRRNFEKPIVTINTMQQVTRLAWCPTRHGLLANSVRDSGAVVLRDIMSWAVSQDEGEASVTERSLQLGPADRLGAVADFAWHPTRENTLLALGTTGRFIEWTVADRLTLNWSARHSLVWSAGSSCLTAMEPAGTDVSDNTANVQESVVDIGVTMRQRAEAGYKGITALSQVASLGLDSDLKAVWSWIIQKEELSSLSQPPPFLIKYQHFRHLGVRSVIRPSIANSSVSMRSWIGLDSYRTARTYVSEERDLILRLCGWEDWKLKKQAESARSCEQILRSAAVAVFSLDLKSAIAILRNATTNARNKGDLLLANTLQMVSFAVSGYSADGAKLWREVVATSVASLPDPALKALFSFLTAEDETFSEVLDEKDGLALTDKIAFAARFLSDRQLADYLEREWLTLLAAGSLQGLMLTSSDVDSQEALQSYLDRTGDLQSVCWLALRILPSVPLRSDKVNTWLESFRQMLDQWGLFSERAELDMALTAADPTRESCQQVSVVCHFCGKSIGSAKKGSNRGMVSNTSSLSRQAGNKAKTQACPNCRKPLPRCAVCLVNMGTDSGNTMLSAGKDDTTKKITSFGDWFSWCQTCRHGGHAGHMIDWFSAHQVCPVTGCTCRCASLDANSQL